jgi:hypothetical protein
MQTFHRRPDRTAVATAHLVDHSRLAKKEGQHGETIIVTDAAIDNAGAFGPLMLVKISADR